MVAGSEHGNYCKVNLLYQGWNSVLTFYKCTYRVNFLYLYLYKYSFLYLTLLDPSYFFPDEMGATWNLEIKSWLYQKLWLTMSFDVPKLQILCTMIMTEAHGGNNDDYVYWRLVKCNNYFLYCHSPTTNTTPTTKQS